MSIQIQNLSKTFGEFKALDNINLHFPAGELVSLLGPSGSGKTTLLRILAGLEKPDQGSVHFQDEEITGTKVQERGAGFVFQHYALFRHLNIFENVAYGLRSKPRAERPTNTKIAERVHELLKLVQLDWVAERFPHQLSGGQRQRIALARALAVEPKFLLLDEPFGALDTLVRRDLRRWLRRLQRELGLTTVLVTHDQEEAMEVSDRIVVLHQGKVHDQGHPWEIFDHTQDSFVYGFLGEVNTIPAELFQKYLLHPQQPKLETQEAVLVRPVDWLVKPLENPAKEFLVDSILPGMREVQLELISRDSDLRIRANLSRAHLQKFDIRVGSSVELESSRYRVFSAEGNIKEESYLNYVI